MSRIYPCVVLMASALAVGCGGDGSDSPIAPTSVSPANPQNCARPSAPSGLTVSVFGNRVTLSWSPMTGILDYEVIIGTSPGNSDMIFTNTTQPTYNWNGGQTGTYYARVGARNSCGSGTTSSAVMFAIIG